MSVLSPLIVLFPVANPAALSFLPCTMSCFQPRCAALESSNPASVIDSVPSAVAIPSLAAVTPVGVVVSARFQSRPSME